MSSIDIGQQARLIQPVIQGVVLDTRYNKDARQLEHLVSYTDSSGESHERWFIETELEGV